MCKIISVLSAEEETTPSLWIEVPKQYTQASLGKKAGKIYGCGGFPNASLDIVYGDLFQRIRDLFSGVETNDKMSMLVNKSVTSFSH